MKLGGQQGKRGSPSTPPTLACPLATGAHRGHPWAFLGTWGTAWGRAWGYHGGCRDMAGTRQGGNGTPWWGGGWRHGDTLGCMKTPWDMRTLRGGGAGGMPWGLKEHEDTLQGTWDTTRDYSNMGDMGDSDPGDMGGEHRDTPGDIRTLPCPGPLPGPVVLGGGHPSRLGPHHDWAHPKTQTHRVTPRPDTPRHHKHPDTPQGPAAGPNGAPRGH